VGACIHNLTLTIHNNSQSRGVHRGDRWQDDSDEVYDGGFEVDNDGGVLEVDDNDRLEVYDNVLRAGVEDCGELRGWGQGRWQSA
jgi:hypothetical protein